MKERFAKKDRKLRRVKVSFDDANLYKYFVGRSKQNWAEAIVAAVFIGNGAKEWFGGKGKEIRRTETIGCPSERSMRTIGCLLIKSPSAPNNTAPAINYCITHAEFENKQTNCWNIASVNYYSTVFVCPTRTHVTARLHLKFTMKKNTVMSFFVFFC